MGSRITVWESLQTQGIPVAKAIIWIDETTLQPTVDVDGISYDYTTQEFRIKAIAIEQEVAGAAGNAIINKSTGVAKIAAAAQEVTITNSKVEADSLVIPYLQSDDATAKSVIAHTIVAGSFKLKLNAAATAQVNVGFFVIRAK